MELFEQIRRDRDRDRERLSLRALAERHGVHLRAMRQAFRSPLPPEQPRDTRFGGDDVPVRLLVNTVYFDVSDFFGALPV